MPLSRDSEQRLVQEPALKYLEGLGWKILDGWKETFPRDDVSSFGRPDQRSVLLWPRLRDALHRLNPTLPPEAFTSAVEELSRDRGAMSLAHACREVYKIVKVQKNSTRMDYMTRFQEMIDAYNAGAINVEVLFKRLVKFSQELSTEEQRKVREGLSEEELAMFDLLTRPEVKLTQKERQEVKKLSRELLETLKHEKLVLDWRKRQQARSAVRVAIEDALEELPEKAYPNGVWAAKCEAVYDHVYRSYFGHGSSIYNAA